MRQVKIPMGVTGIELNGTLREACHTTMTDVAFTVAQKSRFLEMCSPKSIFIDLRHQRHEPRALWSVPAVIVQQSFLLLLGLCQPFAVVRPDPGLQGALALFWAASNVSMQNIFKYLGNMSNYSFKYVNK